MSHVNNWTSFISLYETCIVFLFILCIDENSYQDREIILIYNANKTNYNQLIIFNDEHNFLGKGIYQNTC